MQENVLLQILQEIEICIKKNSRDIALEYVELEINNLIGFTEKNCKNTKYYYYDYYCKYCSNVNCCSNKN